MSWLTAVYLSFPASSHDGLPIIDPKYFRGVVYDTRGATAAMLVALLLLPASTASRRSPAPLTAWCAALVVAVAIVVENRVHDAVGFAAAPWPLWPVPYLPVLPLLLALPFVASRIRESF